MAEHQRPAVVGSARAVDKMPSVRRECQVAIVVLHVERLRPRREHRKSQRPGRARGLRRGDRPRHGARDQRRQSRQGRPDPAVERGGARQVRRPGRSRRRSPAAHPSRFAQPALRVLFETAPHQPADAPRRRRRQGCSSRRARGRRRGVRGCVPPSNARRPVEHLEEHAAERPDVGALVDGLAARLLRAHVGGACRRCTPAGVDDRGTCGRRRRVGAGVDRRGSSAWRGRSRAPSPCRPGGTLMLAGLRSRWTMPRVVRGVERVGDLLRDRRAPPSTASDRRAMRSASVGPSTSSMHERRCRRHLFDAVDLRDVGMVERRRDARLALEPRQAIRIAGDAGRQDLDRDVASEARVARAIDLAHAAGPDGRHDLIRTKARTGGRASGLQGDEPVILPSPASRV